MGDQRAPWGAPGMVRPGVSTWGVAEHVVKGEEEEEDAAAVVIIIIIIAREEGMSTPTVTRHQLLDVHSDTDESGRRRTEMYL